MKTFYLLLLSLIVINCGDKSQGQVSSNDPVLTSDQPQVLTPDQDSIVKTYLEEGAWTKGLYSSGWQAEIDKGLAIDSTIAYLWQQKAMPLYKQGKYEVGLKYLDKAVQYDPFEWQEYRAFMECIFAKNYVDAIADFEDIKAKQGNSIVMDHSYDIYIGMSYLMLNEFEKAEAVLKAEIGEQSKKHGADWVHHLDHFYYGIALYELGKYKSAIEAFDKSLSGYPNFADAMYYKANCLGRLGDKEQAVALIDKAVELGRAGNTINEDNAAYERYPYQVRWH